MAELIATSIIASLPTLGGALSTTGAFAGYTAGTIALAETLSYASVALATTGASLLVNKALAPRPGSASSSQLVVKQSVAPRQRIYGVCKLGGVTFFEESYGGDLYVGQILGQGEIHSFREIWFGDTMVSLASNQSTIETPPFLNYAVVELRYGQDNQSASDLLVSRYGPGANDPPIWSSEHRLRGIAYIVGRFSSPSQEDFLNVYPQGAPTMRCVVEGHTIYDPRNGGQNPLDRTTWGWDANSSLVTLDYLTHQDGMRLPIDHINLDSFKTTATISDETLTYADGTIERRYQAHGTYQLTEKPSDVLKRIGATCDGELHLDSDGRISHKVGKWEEPTVTIGDDDILSWNLKQGAGKLAQYNRLSILFTSPPQDYQETEAQPWDDLALQQQMGRIVTQSLEIPMVISYGQGRRLAKIAMARANPRWVGTITTTLVGLRAKRQRFINVVISELGISESFAVTSFTLAGDLTSCTIGIASLSSDAFDFAPGDEGAAPSDTGVADVPFAFAPPAYVEIVFGSRSIGDSSGTFAYIIGPPPPTASVLLRVQYRTDGGEWRVLTANAGDNHVQTDLLNAGHDYDVQAWFIAPGAASDKTAILTRDAIAAPDPPDDATTVAAVQNGLISLITFTRSASENLAYTRIYRGTTATFADASAIQTIWGGHGLDVTATDTPGTGSWFYWVVSFNASDEASDGVGPLSVTIPD